MKISRPSPSMVVAGIALFVSLGGTSIAAVNYVSNAGAVDGKSAVFAGASLVTGRGQARRHQPLRHRQGPPARASSSPTSPKTQTFSNVFEVADNAPGAPQTVSTHQRPRAR